MKTLFFLSLAILLLLSCNQTETRQTTGRTDSSIDNSGTGRTDDPSGSNDLPVARDITITPANAYNQLFLDSNVLESYIVNKKLPDQEAVALRNFYNPRNFGYAWFSTDGVTAEAMNFWNAYTYHGMEKEGEKDKALILQMDTLLNATDSMTIIPADSSWAQSEIALTQKFLKFRQDAGNKHMIAGVPLWQLLPSRKMDPAIMADSILQLLPGRTATDTGRNPYHLLRKALATWLGMAKSGNWDTLKIKGPLKKGLSSPIVTGVKKRLQMMGYLPASDTSARFGDTLETAIKDFQLVHGWKADGMITAGVIKDLNTSPTLRLSQLISNMNRMLWLPETLPANYIQVNIPEFLLKVHQDTGKSLEMKIIAGDEGTRTMMFAGDLNQVVFSPYWNLPQSIVKKETVPAMKRDPGYLKKHNMEIVGKQTDPPVIRQRPGPGNALGKVKFLFPNSYDIYLHDTEAKSLFDAKTRAFSHGCIRLQDAEKMANYVLRNDPLWTAEKIHTAMNSNNEQVVKLKQTIPVYITYFTCWVDGNGILNFRDDVYGHDKKMANKLFPNN
ncbi:MAG: L,D-transpeptidase family protein [Bacteroidota bacterium]